MTAKDHSKLLGILFAIHAGLQAFIMLILVLIYGGLGTVMLTSARRDEEQIVGAIFIVAMIAIFFFSLLFIIPQGVAGFKLLKNKSNARFWAIFGAIVVLLSFPFGTALGIYALWFLLGDVGKNYFNGHSEVAPPPPPQNWR